jgi:phenylalanyl-tRNA synthetase beta chain
VRPARCAELLGVSLSAQRVRALLERLGLAPEEDAEGTVRCAVPSRRRDLTREVDLIEEVARLHGLEHVPVHPRMPVVTRPPQPRVRGERAMRHALAAGGYWEAITFSLIDAETAALFLEEGAQTAEVIDPRRRQRPALRPSLLPGLLTCRKTNQDLGNEGLRLFERATAWWRDEQGRLQERRRVALLRDVDEDGAQHAARAVRGMLDTLAERLAGLSRLEVEPAPAPGFGDAARLRMRGHRVGVFGLVGGATRAQFGLRDPCVAAELDADALLNAYPPARPLQALPRLPGIARDVSIVVDEEVPWARLEQAIRAVEPEKLEALAFLTTYRGKPIPKGRKSVSFRMRFRDPEKSLRHEEVDPQTEAVVARLREDVGAELR